MMAQQFTDGDFEKEVLQSELPVLVDFWAVWCGPCRVIAPIVEELSTELEGKVKVGKVDVDSNPVIASQYGIRSIPTLLVFKNGAVVEQMVGALPKQEIVKMLNNHVSEPV
jgi:thioredoxin 1